MRIIFPIYRHATSSIMLLRRSLIKTDRVSYLLISNSYIAFITASPLFIEMCITSIYGHLHPNISFDGWNCRVKSYVLYIHGCVYFYSFLLQAIYRFCRIVHPTRVVYQSFRPYAILSVAQWILAALMLLPSLFLGDLEYLPNDYHCQIGPTNLRGSMIGLSVLFIVPFVSTLMFYLYTLYYVYTKTTVLTTINRNTTARRDLIILSRLVFLFTFITTVAFPHVLIPVIYTISGSLASWVSPCEWLFTAFSLSAACIIQFVVSPNLRKLRIRPTCVRPLVMLRPIVYPIVLPSKNDNTNKLLHANRLTLNREERLDIQIEKK